MPVISVRDLIKTYDVGEVKVHALRGVKLDVERRRVPRGDGTVGLGQVHASCTSSAAWISRRRASTCSTARTSPR